MMKPFPSLLLALFPMALAAAAPISQPMAYSLATRVLPLSDGSRFVAYYLPPSYKSIGGAIFKGARQIGAFTADAWIPKGSSAADDRGQIFSADLFPDGQTLLVSYGWHDINRNVPANAIAVLRRADDGSWTLKRNIYFRGNVGDVAAGPGNLILALNYRYPDKTQTEEWPLLVILDTDGKTRGYAFRNPLGMNSSDGWLGARLQRVDGNTFALLDPFADSVRVFDADPGGSVALMREVSIADRPVEFDGYARGQVEIRGFAVTKRGSIVVVRDSAVEGHDLAVITTYATRGGRNVTTKRVMNKKMNIAFYEQGSLLGIYPEYGKPTFEDIAPVEP